MIEIKGSMWYEKFIGSNKCSKCQGSFVVEAHDIKRSSYGKGFGYREYFYVDCPYCYNHKVELK